MRDAVIVEAVRTPVGKRNGGLAGVHPADLSSHVLTALADRAGIDPAVVEDVVWGCVGQVGEQTFDIARNAVLGAGWPESVPGVTIDRQCGSSQQAVSFAAASVMAKDPAALQLRLLQTVVEVAGEKNSTLVMPVPVELLRFFEKMAPGQPAPEGSTALADAEAQDLGDAEVAAAEAAISHTAAPTAAVPALNDTEVPPVPAVPSVPEIAGPRLGEPDLAPGEEVPVTERVTER